MTREQHRFNSLKDALWTIAGKGGEAGDIAERALRADDLATARDTRRPLDKWQARFATNGSYNRRPPGPWFRFRELNTAAHEMRRALFGIDKPWGTDFYPRLRRFILSARQFPKPRLP